MKTSLLLSVLLASTALLLTQSAAAQGAQPGTRPLGMASAFTANANGNGALYHNPAGIGSSLVYSVEGTYGLSPDLNTFTASVVDSKLNQKISAGFSYSYEQSRKDNLDLSGHDGRLALATQFIPGRLVAGIGGRYMQYEQDGKRIFDGFTLDIGTIVQVTDGFFLGAAGNNLIDICSGDTDNSCPASAAPRSARGGFAFGSSVGFQLVGEAHADLSDSDKVKMSYAAGLEGILYQLVALRGGYRYKQEEEANIIAFGGGVKGQSAGLDIAYQRDLTAKTDEFSLSIQLFLF